MTTAKRTSQAALFSFRRANTVAIGIEIAQIQGRLLVAGLDDADIADLDEYAYDTTSDPNERLHFWHRQARQNGVTL